MMKQTIDHILSHVTYLDNEYFVSLHNGSLDKEDFTETQIQFFHAVDFFSRAMAVLSAKIPTAHMRLEVLRNVWEEHGEGETSFAHTSTFTEFLKRLSHISPDDIAARLLWPETRIFNTALMGACALDDYCTGIATMGIIEYMFSHISTRLGSGILGRGWLNEASMIHYDCHATLDVKHADDFFAIIQDTYDANAENRYYIDQGLWMGATLFNDFYTGLYRHRKRRLMRDAKIPHSRATGQQDHYVY